MHQREIQMAKCIFSTIDKCKSDDSSTFITAGPQRIETIISCSKTYEDGLYIPLEDELEKNSNYTINVHRACVSTYTSKLHVSRFLKRRGDVSTRNDVSPKRRRRSGTPAFDFLQHCIFCGEKCDVEKDTKNPGRWRRAYVCRTAGDADSKHIIMEKCELRRDKWSDEVQLRIQGAVSDLHAADARYHADCKANFMAPRSVHFASSISSEAVEIDNAFEYLCGVLLQDRKRVWNSVELFDMYTSEGGDKLTRKVLLEKLCNRIGDDLLVLSASGVASIIVFKSKAPAMLKLVNDTDDGDIDAAIKLIRKHIVSEVKSYELDKTRYFIRLTKENVENPVSNTLMRLLAKISDKLDNTPSAYLIGSIVTKSVINFPTPLQVAIGVLVRNSKELVNHLSEFGVSCNYDELLRFKKSAALSAASSTILQGISDSQSGLVQVVVDNFDADISSQNGKRSTHSLAMLVTQPMNEDSCPEEETIKRIDKGDIPNPIDYNINVEYNNGPKKPNMPEQKSKKTVLPLHVLARMALSAKRASDIDATFMCDITGKDTCPEYNGYNTKLSREQGHSTKGKTKAVYLPLIDMTPSDPDTIKTAMVQAQQISSDCGQEFTVMTGDLQLYRVAVSVLWSFPGQFDNVILRLGGMHTLMSFVGAVGTLMGGSGLSEILETTFGGVNKMLTGKKFPQNVRALRLVAEELIRPILEANPIENYTDLDIILENIAARSRTSKIWIDCCLKCVFIMMMFIRAEREGDWPLHMYAVKEMLPYFFAAGHVNYARYGLYYLRSMEGMPENCREKFMKGEHVMRHREGIWNAIWSDMFIETTFMRYGHGRKGIIGITLKPETLKTWSLSLHICSRMEEDLRCFAEGEHKSEQEQHKEEQKGRIESDVKDRESIRRKLKECIDPLNPETHPHEIINIVSGKMSPDFVNVDRALEIGQNQMSEFEKGWPEKFYEKISHVVKTQAEAGKYIKVGDYKVFDTELIYSRVIGLQASSRELDVRRLLTYELAPVPTSMFADTGEMRISKAKSVLKRSLQNEVSSRGLIQNVSTVIIDGSAILYCIRWSAGGTATVGDYVKDFRRYVIKQLSLYDVFLVFDRYKEYSTKVVARDSRGAAQQTRIHQLSVTMQLPPQKTILAVPANKKQLIELIVDDLCTNLRFPENSTPNRRLVVTGENKIPIEITRTVKIQRHDLRTSHEEADNILAQQMVYVAKETRKDLSVVSDDTDVFLLLMYHYAEQGLDVQVYMESPVKERAVVDIKRTACENVHILTDILAAHALTGCDTTACYFGIGKGTVLKVLRSGNAPIPSVGDMAADFDTVVQQSTRFVSGCYNISSDTANMSDVRQRVWTSKVGKSPSAAPKLCTLPPTSEAFRENVKRAHFQTCIWKNALAQDPPDVDITLYGWEKHKETRSLSPVLLPQGTQLAPAEVLQMIKCSCVSQAPCSTLRCRCSSARLSCTMFCACQGSVVCKNEQNIQL